MSVICRFDQMEYIYKVFNSNWLNFLLSFFLIVIVFPWILLSCPRAFFSWPLSFFSFLVKSVFSYFFYFLVFFYKFPPQSFNQVCDFGLISVTLDSRQSLICYFNVDVWSVVTIFQPHWHSIQFWPVVILATLLNVDIWSVDTIFLSYWQSFISDLWIQVWKSIINYHVYSLQFCFTIKWKDLLRLKYFQIVFWIS